MKIGAGFSREKTPQAALQEAYRKSLQKIGATKADCALVFYSYDFGLDSTALGAAAKKVFRDTRHIGTSSWAAWFQRDGFEAETGLLVVSLKDIQNFEFFKVHSLKEKAELWVSELSRQMVDKGFAQPGVSKSLLFCIVDSLCFSSGSGFSALERQFPGMQVCGMGASYSVPQVTLLMDGEVHFNSMVAIGLREADAWVGIAQNIQGEQKPIEINRMSENLVIEIDHKPAFYRLCEHLMAQDDLPMMAPDEFRKHMGDLYIVEVPRVQPKRTRTVGEIYQAVSLLGSEMTTGMVAVAQELDFNREHYLGQKKVVYAEESLRQVLEEIRLKIENPRLLIVAASASRMREKERKIDDHSLIRSLFPHTELLFLASQGEYLGGGNSFAALVIAFP